VRSRTGRCAGARQIDGEELVAFRDTEGRIGSSRNIARIAACRSIWAQRGVRLRCVYHGWKFDVTGACVDQLNEPEEHQFKHKVKLTAYPTCELGGIVWAYLGPAGKMPRSEFAWTQVPEPTVTSPSHRGSNYLQALEGGIDTSHARSCTGC